MNVSVLIHFPLHVPMIFPPVQLVKERPFLVALLPPGWVG